VRNLNPKTARGPGTSRKRLGSKAWALSGVAAALVSAAGMAQAQQATSTSSTSAAPVDQSLTWHGITLYGIVDVGIQYETHGAPFNDYFISGGSDIVQKNSNNPVFGVTSNGLSQSRIGLQGKESLHFLDFSGVFKLESYFNPASGELTDALKSLTQNNGRPLASQSTNIDSSLAGIPFEQSFAGVSSPTFGTLTFGRQNTTLADLISKYDPQQTSYAFSLIGLSGTPAGGGATQDRRLDDSLKYYANYFNLVHFGVQYKFQNATAENYATAGSGEAFSAIEVSFGAEYAGASVDAFYTKVRDAISASALSAEQVGDLPTYSLSISNSVAATVSDNASYGVMGSYNLSSLLGGAAPVTIYGAYQHITFTDPSIALPVGFDDIGGYVLGAVNNKAYAKADRVLQVYWAGARYALTDQLNVAIAYYGEKQESYATGKNLGCSSTVSGQCSGNLNVASVSFDYHFTKRFDSYAGVMWSNVSHGLANGYLNTTLLDPTIGVRFSF
jgi:predicted porin